jgi:hypothetical protein
MRLRLAASHVTDDLPLRYGARLYGCDGLHVVWPERADATVIGCDNVRLVVELAIAHRNGELSVTEHEWPLPVAELVDRALCAICERDGHSPLERAVLDLHAEARAGVRQVRVLVERTPRSHPDPPSPLSAAHLNAILLDGVATPDLHATTIVLRGGPTIELSGIDLESVHGRIMDSGATTEAQLPRDEWQAVVRMLDIRTMLWRADLAIELPLAPLLAGALAANDGYVETLAALGMALPHRRRWTLGELDGLAAQAARRRVAQRAAESAPAGDGALLAAIMPSADPRAGGARRVSCSFAELLTGWDEREQLALGHLRVVHGGLLTQPWISTAAATATAAGLIDAAARLQTARSQDRRGDAVNVLRRALVAVHREPRRAVRELAAATAKVSDLADATPRSTRLRSARAVLQELLASGCLTG